MIIDFNKGTVTVSKLFTDNAPSGRILDP